MPRIMICLLMLVWGLGAAEYVWLEAEDAPLGSAGGNESHAELSGGRWRWINNQDSPEQRFLEWEAVSISEGGPYQVYVRKFWSHGPLRWRFNDQPWQNLTRADTVLLDSVSIGGNVANWVHLGQVDLTPGNHRFRVEMLEATGASAIDCFIITNQPFIARGRLKPEEKYGTAPDGWFPFEPDLDHFAPSPIDLRRLNEPRAGQRGRVRVVDGRFVQGADDRPLRFWAVNVNASTAGLDDNSLAYLARQYAKYGVNMVRYHSPVYHGSGPQSGVLDPQRVHNLQRLITAMQAEGIFTTVSLYFPLWLRPDPDNPVLQGYSGGDDRPNLPFAILFFDDDFQQLYRGWWQAVMETVNPATGLSLAEDPALAAIELVNEDSFLFWTFNPDADPSNIPAVYHQALQTRFHDWLVQRHGSIANAYAVWGSGPITGDDPAAGRMALRSLWHMQEFRTARDQDTTRFLTEVQEEFFSDHITWIGQTLGYGGLISCSNWKTANDEILGPADKHSNTVGHFMDRHGYFGGSVTGDGSQSYSVRVGHAYHDRAAVRFDPPEPGGDRVFALPIMDHTYNGLPSIISEIAWSRPNRFRADGVVLMAAYGALQGTDAIHHFATTGATWEQMLSKWPLQAPLTMGQYPATALLYRQGLIDTADLVADIRLSLDQVYGLAGTPVPEPGNFDPLRLADVPEGGGGIAPGSLLDPLTYLVGRINVSFGGEGSSQVQDLSAHIDRDAGQVRSLNDQLHWDYHQGLVRLDSPRAQGATGFLEAAGAIVCADLTATLNIPYGSLLVVPLDGRPLAESGNILVQVASEEDNNGFQTTTRHDGRLEITDLGSPPLVVRRLVGSLALTRADADQLQVRALDLNGYHRSAHGQADHIDLLPDVLYYHISDPRLGQRQIRMREEDAWLWSIAPQAGAEHEEPPYRVFDQLETEADHRLQSTVSSDGEG